MSILSEGEDDIWPEAPVDPALRDSSSPSERSISPSIVLARDTPQDTEFAEGQLERKQTEEFVDGSEARHFQLSHAFDLPDLRMRACSRVPLIVFKSHWQSNMVGAVGGPRAYIDSTTRTLRIWTDELDQKASDSEARDATLTILPDGSTRPAGQENSGLYRKGFELMLDWTGRAACNVFLEMVDAQCGVTCRLYDDILPPRTFEVQVLQGALVTDPEARLLERIRSVRFQGGRCMIESSKSRDGSNAPDTSRITDPSSKNDTFDSRALDVKVLDACMSQQALQGGVGDISSEISLDSVVVALNSWLEADIPPEVWCQFYNRCIAWRIMCLVEADRIQTANPRYGFSLDISGARDSISPSGG